MSRSGRNSDRRVKTAKKRTASSTRWLERQLNDPYVKQAKADGYRSRAAYKLIELDDRFGLIRGAKRVVDLGIAPGGWTQVVRAKAPKAEVVGIDLLPTEPIEGATIFEMDFMDDAAPAKLEEALGGPPDLVLSDMAANTVGHKQTDHLRTMALVEAGAWFATETLEEGGAEQAVEKVNDGLDRIRGFFAEHDAEEEYDDDELVAVTPTQIRIRKKLLTESARKRASRKSA